MVYKARHLAPDDIMAVKLLLKPQDQTDRKRFLLEARLATKIKHPNTVYVSDFGLLADGRSYRVMEFMHGQMLSGALRDGPMESLRACRIAVQIARGRQAVHEHSIVHREQFAVVDSVGSTFPETASIVERVPEKRRCSGLTYNRSNPDRRGED